jgi:AcrR family transcriptional regulator
MEQERPLRADAERNRRRLLDAAEEMFGERGLDVGVAEIAARAGVGRGTLFRNFASKEDLIAAIVVERMSEATARGRALLDADDPADALFELLAEMAGRQQAERALFEAVADTFLANADIAAAYGELMGVVEQLVERAQRVGAVRDDVGAVDVIMMVKGVCEAASALQHVNPQIADRQLDLVRAALSAGHGGGPLRGAPPTIDDLHRAHPAAASTAPPAAKRARAK